MMCASRSALKRVIMAGCTFFATFTVASCSSPSKVVPAAAVQAPILLAAAPRLAPPVQDLVTDSRAIAAAQHALVQLGYDVGKPDGVAGPTTRRGILAFQKEHALIEDGLLTNIVADKLKILLAEKARAGVLTVGSGDTLIYSDGSVEIAATEHVVQWEEGTGARAFVAIRPSTVGWPPAAKAGLEWATTHALDMPGPPVQWSSTGVSQHFEIRTSPELSQREIALAGPGAQSCRRFEMRTGDHRYPAVACLDANRIWYIPHTHIQLARPASALQPRTAPKSLPMEPTLTHQ
jgi:peptidoglycan hydrolase-like protein with peptidoglycan-binding domain